MMAIDDTSTEYDNAEEPEIGSQGAGPSLVDKFVIRLPQGLRDQIRTLSEHNHRSMNSEIIMVLEKHIQQSLQERFGNEAEGEHNGKTGALQPADEVLSEKLKALPPEKKEALLSLLK